MRIKAKNIFGIIFFVLVFLYFRLRVDPRLIYHAQEPPFLLDAEFFSSFSKYPGGLAWYASAFFTQFYIYPLAGAFIITFFIFLIRWQTMAFVKSVGITSHREMAGILPALVFVAASSNYLLPLSYVVELFVALLFFNLYRFHASPRMFLRLARYGILLVIVYYAAGTGALVFAVLCALDELLVRKKYLAGLIILGTVSFVPAIAAEYFFVILVPQAYYDLIGVKTYLLDAAAYPRTPLIVYGIYAFFPALLSAHCLILKIEKKQDQRKWSAIQTYAEKIGSFLNSPAGHYLQAAFVALILAYSAFCYFDAKAKANYRIDLAARYRHWDAIAEAMKPAELNNYSVLSQMHLFRALYYNGRLLSDLFSYTPSGLPGLSFQLVTGAMAKQYPVQMSDCYFDIGGLNMAEYWAHEALALQGKKPWILRRLALIYLLKGQKKTAEKFITLLGKTLFFKDTAAVYARMLGNDSLLDNNSYLRQVRSYALCKEYTCRDFYYELTKLLDNNSRNKIAFEYLMAESLLNNGISSIIDNMAFFNDIGYERLPRHIQEAMVFEMVLSNSTAASVGNYQLDNELFRQFNDFNQILYRDRDDRAGALKKLAAQYGDTYWYYLALTNRPVQLKKKE